MPYTTKMSDAAVRHFVDGQSLETKNRLDNAGYHYGLAAECAIKHALIAAGVREDEEVIWVHFPELLNFAIAVLKGRRSSPISGILGPSLMQGWAIKMRYAENGSVPRRDAERWRDQANRAMGLVYV